MQIMTRRSGFHTAAAVLLSLLVLSGCATDARRSDLEQGRLLAASGKLAEAYTLLDKASLAQPSSDELWQAAESSRLAYGDFLVQQAARATKDQNWAEAERRYKQLGGLLGFEDKSREGLRLLAEKQPSQPKAMKPEPSVVSVQAVPVAPSAPRQEPVAPTPTPTPAPIAVAAAPAAVAPALPAPVSASSTVAETKKLETPLQLVPTLSKPLTAAVPPVEPAVPVAPVRKEDDPLKRLVTLEFRDASVRSLFDAVSRTSGLNVIFDRDVSPDIKTTVYLRNTSIKAALDKIVLTSGLAWRSLDENTLLVYNDEKIKQHDYQALSIRSFQLENADAKTVAKSLRTLLKFRDLVVDSKLNMIMVRDTPEAIAMAEKMIAMQDVAEPEVMLEVAILEVSKGKLQNLGVLWPSSLSLSPLARTSATTGSVTDPVTGLPVSSGSNVLTLRDLFNLTPGSLSMGLGQTTVNFNATNSDVNVLANPRIRTRNREKAKILIGERVPQLGSNTTSTGIVSQNVTYIDVGLKLDVEPQIYPGNDIGLKISLEVSTINGTVENRASGTVAYRIGTRNATTMLRLRDGENQILAGLIQDNEKRTVSKVPLLGDIPILGRLFRSDSDDKSKTELILSITPRLIRGNERLSPQNASFDAGTFSSVRGRRADGEEDPAANDDASTESPRAEESPQRARSESTPQNGIQRGE